MNPKSKKRWLIGCLVALASLPVMICLASLGFFLFVESVCAHVSAQACTGIADAIAQKDMPRAAGLYQQACDRGDPAACTVLGVSLAVGRGIPQDLGRAMPLLERGCQAHAWGACGQLAMAYWTGRGRSLDRNRAVALDRQGCTDGDLFACAWAALALREGIGAPRDVARANAELERVCDAGDDIACADAGRRLRDGPQREFTRDRVFGEALLRRGCARGLRRTCAALAAPTP